jgi:hypothetical protein
VITILYVPPDGPAEVRDIDPTLDTLQGLVGGNIQAISGPGWTAYLNEEGKLLGLPGNAVATALAARLGWIYLFGDLLVGPVIFCGPPDDDDGYDTSVVKQVLDEAARRAGHVG